LDGILLKRSWGGEIKNVSLLAVLGVDQDGYRRVLGVVEGHKEDKAGWLGFLKHLKKRGLKGVRVIISDACLGLSEAAGECFPEAAWQRCTVHFYRNVFSHVPRGKVRAVAAMLKAIDAQESRAAALDKAQDVGAKLKAMKLGAAAKLVGEKIDETLTYYAFPSQHWLKIRTNNPMERLLKEARRRTKVVGAFPDGNSALMLVAARLRHVSATQWGMRKYMNMRLLEEMEKEIRYSAA
jgi:transposase-like protein